MAALNYTQLQVEIKAVRIEPGDCRVCLTIRQSSYSRSVRVMVVPSWAGCQRAAMALAKTFGKDEFLDVSHPTGSRFVRVDDV